MLSDHITESYALPATWRNFSRLPQHTTFAIGPQHIWGPTAKQASWSADSKFASWSIPSWLGNLPGQLWIPHCIKLSHDAMLRSISWHFSANQLSNHCERCAWMEIAWCPQRADVEFSVQLVVSVLGTVLLWMRDAAWCVTKLCDSSMHSGIFACWIPCFAAHLTICAISQHSQNSTPLSAIDICVPSGRGTVSCTSPNWLATRPYVVHVIGFR